MKKKKRNRRYVILLNNINSIPICHLKVNANSWHRYFLPIVDRKFISALARIDDATLEAIGSDRLTTEYRGHRLCGGNITVLRDGKYYSDTAVVLPF